ncbi:unnamed protein product [Didymodactylos carnosus]|uniref:Uncharacterized protein n=1 Tax=Didymodactylos carnosus TaxID=1234261 RepID=A0A815A8Q3_9BILA|nr:unnamed protein product [Didymodactylos carnosus]CAF1252675.1 unnamed protein product [Didymodactylos carnosus]CAF3845700.1 unnamed protein product [Didymodactylos carnosus]CAF4022997.1 unnamed protein product [Didymodactylos carnosus]
MAASNSKKRVIRQEPGYRKNEPYFTQVDSVLPSEYDPKNRSGLSNHDNQVIHSADSLPSSRQIVVVRNPKNPNINLPVRADFGDLIRPNSATLPVSQQQTPQKTVYVIRRPIPPNPAQPPPPQSNVTRSHNPANIVIVDQTQGRSRGRSPSPVLEQPPVKVETPVPPAEENIDTTEANRSLNVHFRRPSTPYARVDDKIPKETPRKKVSLRKVKNTTVQVSPPSSPVDNKTQIKQQKVTFVDDDETISDNVKSIVLVNPEKQSIAVIENPYVNGVSIREKRKTNIHDETQTENHRHSLISHETIKVHKQTCMQVATACCSRRICLIIVLCLILALIALAGLAVSLYFLFTDTTDFTSEIVGVAVSGVLFIVAMCVMYIILACVGVREGYFLTNRKYVGGTAYALIPPTHPNASRYVPEEYWKMVEDSYRNNLAYHPDAHFHQRHQQKTPASYVSNVDSTEVRRKQQETQYYQDHRLHHPQHVQLNPSVQYHQPQQVELNPSVQYHQPQQVELNPSVQHHQPQQVQPNPSVQVELNPSVREQQQIELNPRVQRQKDKNFIIEMPEKLLTGRKISPRSRERSLKKVVTDIGYIVDDAKKRYNGDVPNKVIVQVDKKTQQ